MAGPLSFQGIQEGEALERCDGCDHFHPIGELVPIGDGSIRVCRHVMQMPLRWCSPQDSGKGRRALIRSKKTYPGAIARNRQARTPRDSAQ